MKLAKKLRRASPSQARDAVDASQTPAGEVVTASDAVTHPAINVSRLSSEAELRARVEHLFAVVREHRAYELAVLAGIERELRGLEQPP